MITIRKNMLLILSSAIMAVSCSGRHDAPDTVRTVDVATAESMTDTSARKYPFISEPCRTAELAFRVGGHIAKLDVQEGQFFRRGEVIAALDARDFIVRKRRAAAICRQAKAEYERTTRLFKAGNIAEQEYERARADYERAKADYDMAADELDRTQLIAPFSGYVQTQHVERYQDVAAGQPVVTFIDMSRIKAEAYVPEDIAAQLQQNIGGRTCLISFDRMSGRTFRPAETYITRTATGNNMAFKLTALIDNGKSHLPGGMSGNMLIGQTSNKFVGVAVPQKAVWSPSSGGSCVWTIDNGGRVCRRNVVTGRLLGGGMIEICSGLKAGERVATAGQAMLNEGDTVATQAVANRKGGMQQ